MNNIHERLDRLLAKKEPALPNEWPLAALRDITGRRELFLEAAGREGSPLYVFEPARLRARAKAFQDAFREEIPGFQAYFAMKSNNNPQVAAGAVAAGLGLDVSSGVELAVALSTGCEKILFSGPGKTSAELELAAANASRVTVLMDSFTEFPRLEAAALKLGVTMRAGVRLTTQEDGLWKKFGIPLARLEEFFRLTQESKSVRFCGLQFHTSWNLSPAAQLAFLDRLGEALSSLPPHFPAKLEFLDIGGGYWPEVGEWVHLAATDQGKALELLDPANGRPKGRVGYAAGPIKEFAVAIGAALSEKIFPLVRCEIYGEPGRWVCHDSMHLLLTVLDKKGPGLVITDGGTNLVGWERFEQDYFPVVNLTRPSETEHECLVLGSLCTPHDVWGYGYRGEGIEIGDVLVIPWQGAYTWSLRQEFIKPVAKVAVLRGSR